MRWTIWADGDDIYTKPLPGWTKVEVVPASFTDEDVERVAEGIAEAEGLDCFSEDAELPGEAPVRAMDRARYRELARAALTAYLEPTTKKET